MRAILLLAALAVAATGIGVGVISTSGAMSYGPLGERFTAAFVSSPRVVQARVGGEHAIGYCAKDSTTSETVMIVDNLRRVTSTSYAEAVQVLSRAGCAIVGWVAYSPLSEPDPGKPRQPSCNLDTAQTTTLSLNGSSGYVLVAPKCSLVIATLSSTRGTDRYFLWADGTTVSTNVAEFVNSFHALSG
jgi:hypothetical protein